MRDDSASFEAMTTAEMERMRTDLNASVALDFPLSARYLTCGEPVR